jgi:hypothetical protein
MRVVVTVHIEWVECGEKGDSVVSAAVPGVKGNETWSDSMDLTKIDEAGESSQLTEQVGDFLSALRRKPMRSASLTKASARRAHAQLK